MASFELRGVLDVQNRTKAGVNTIWEKAIEALGEEANEVLAISQTRVPVNTGALKRSGRVTGPEVKGKEASYTISFGDESVRYAIPVHERLRARHLVGGAKFLESVISEEESRMLGRINAKIKI